MPFTCKQFDIPGVKLITPKIFRDERGFFSETFKSSDFHAFGITEPFVQDNYSKSQAGVLRGLHYQAQPKAQGKLIQVLQGSVFDVVVDLRIGSHTFGKWESAILSDENHHIMWVPPGFAHGFCVLSDEVNFIYKCTNYYDPSAERGLRWDDPELNIPWPVKNPILSAKDKVYPGLHDLKREDLLRYVP